MIPIDAAVLHLRTVTLTGMTALAVDSVLAELDRLRVALKEQQKVSK